MPGLLIARIRVQVSGQGLEHAGRAFIVLCFQTGGGHLVYRLIQVVLALAVAVKRVESLDRSLVLALVQKGNGLVVFRARQFLPGTRVIGDQRENFRGAGVIRTVGQLDAQIKTRPGGQVRRVLVIPGRVIQSGGAAQVAFLDRLTGHDVMDFLQLSGRFGHVRRERQMLGRLRPLLRGDLDQPQLIGTLLGEHRAVLEREDLIKACLRRRIVPGLHQEDRRFIQAVRRPAESVKVIPGSQELLRGLLILLEGEQHVAPGVIGLLQFQPCCLPVRKP